MSTLQKKFALQHTFKNVSNMKEAIDVYSDEDVHFGVPWKMYINRKNGHLGLYLKCLKPLDVGKWSIKTKFMLKAISKDGTHFVLNTEKVFGNQNSNKTTARGSPTFMNWNIMENEYLTDDSLDVEAHVTIKEMTGCEKQKLRNFDENKLADVALIVGNKTFYVVKKLLAYQSTYFDKLFFGNFSESNKSEVILKDIDPEDFQSFLELIHGESAIDDNTIDGIIRLANMYDTPVAIRRCEEFLMNQSKMTIKKKWQISTKYHLTNLKNKCLSEINSIEDIRSVAYFDGMDASTATTLLHKSLSFQ